MVHQFQLSNNDLIFEHVYKTSISGLWFIEHDVHKDDRGAFTEIGLIPDIEKVIGQPFHIKQMNVARSYTNVIRGFHAEHWNKYVTVIRGTAFCALADVNPNSETFGDVETFLMGDSDNDLHGSLIISKGLANSVCVVNGPIDYLYAVDALYRDRDTSGDVAYSLFDPTLAVPWPIPREQMIISPRDQQAITLKEKFPEKY